MSATHEITAFDVVELIEPVKGVPAGASGGVLEVRDHDVAMVEITEPPGLDGVDRIIFVPLAQLRAVR